MYHHQHMQSKDTGCDLVRRNKISKAEINKIFNYEIKFLPELYFSEVEIRKL